MRKIFFDEIGLRFVWHIIFMVMGLFMFFYVTIGVVEKTIVPGEMAKIDELRASVSKVSPTESEDVMGLVVECNMRIRSQQYFNTKWWACMIIPNEWDSVELIEIPSRKD